MIEVLVNYILSSGFGQVTAGNTLMIVIGLLFIFLAVKKGFEPLLLVPIGFGMIVGNIPYPADQLSLSVYDGPPDPAYTDKVQLPDTVLLRTRQGQYVRLPAEALCPPSSLDSYNGQPALPTAIVDTSHLYDQPMAVRAAKFAKPAPVYEPQDPQAFLENPRAHLKQLKPTATRPDQLQPGEVVLLRLNQGKLALADLRGLKPTDTPPDTGWPLVVSKQQLNPWNASVLWFLYRGVKWGFYPALIFLGIGAMTDFSSLLSNPKLFLLGAAAQVGIFGALIMAVLMGFELNEAASIGIIGGADGPTAIFVTARLAPEMLGAIALAAYSYMALVPVIQPPIMKLLTTQAERRIRMKRPPQVSKNVKLMFPLVGFLLTSFIAPGGLALLAMLFFGNLLKESLVTERLAKTARTSMIDVVTILLGLTVGATTTASNFLTWETVGIFVLGAFAFSIATAGGVLFAKIMNRFTADPLNPLIGAAGVSAVPMAARVVQVVATKEDPHNHLLEHAMGPNVAGVIGSAVAAGVLLSKLATVS